MKNQQDLKSQLLEENKITKNINSILLVKPKFDYNVAGAIRAAGCFGIFQVVFTGRRIYTSLGKKHRPPREERMKCYSDVNIVNDDYPFKSFDNGFPKIAIERMENSECIYDFIHPKNAVYVFGPENGSIGQSMLKYCHRFVHIPTFECLNLAATINIVLYDRNKKANYK